MNEREALDRIAALCDERLRRSQGPALIESVGLLTVAEVRAILAEVTPETGDPVPYRLGYEAGYADALRDVKDNAEPGDDRMADRAVWYRKGWEAALREAGGTLDRDQARAIAYEYLDPYGIHGQPEPHAVKVVEGFLDRLARCVRPVAGVLDRDQARAALWHDIALPEDMEDVLDALARCVRPVAGVTLDRDQAYRVLADVARRGYLGDALDRLAACVRPATIDRDDLTIALNVLVASDRHDAAAVRETVDHILALVRPGTVVTLTPEEKALVVATLHTHAIEYTPEKESRMEALAARLAAAHA